MLVRAIDLGYYGEKRRRPGEEFQLAPRKFQLVDPATNKVVKRDGKPVMKAMSAEDQFSESWMEIVEESPKVEVEIEPEKPKESKKPQGKSSGDKKVL